MALPQGARITQQAFEVAKKSKRVDDLLRRNRKARKTMGEIHPEVCFWAFNGYKPMAFSKKSHNGFWERLRLMRDVSAEAYRATVELTVDGKGSAKVAPDVVLDAMVAALTATAPCTALGSLPSNPPRDKKDLPMRMLYTTRDHVRVRT